MQKGHMESNRGNSQLRQPFHSNYNTAKLIQRKVDKNKIISHTSHQSLNTVIFNIMTTKSFITDVTIPKYFEESWFKNCFYHTLVMNHSINVCGGQYCLQHTFCQPLSFTEYLKKKNLEAAS